MKIKIKAGIIVQIVSIDWESERLKNVNLFIDEKIIIYKIIEVTIIKISIK